MKLKDILRGAAAVAGTIHPGVGAAIGLVNKFLPEDKKLPGESTGQEVLDAVGQLPAEQQAQILDREFEYKITDLKESHDTIRTMLTADASTPHSTRPKIALQAFQLLAIVTFMVVFGWLWSALTGKAETVTAIMDGWPFLLSLLAPFAALLRAYFGILKAEHQNKLNAASGVPTKGIADVMSSLIRKG